MKGQGFYLLKYTKGQGKEIYHKGPKGLTNKFYGLIKLSIFVIDSYLNDIYSSSKGMQF